MKYSGKRSIILNNSSQDTQVKSIRKFSSDVKPAQNKTAKELFELNKRQSAKIERRDNSPMDKSKIPKIKKTYSIKDSSLSNDAYNPLHEHKELTTPSAKCKRLPNKVTAGINKTSPSISSSFKSYNYSVSTVERKLQSKHT